MAGESHENLILVEQVQGVLAKRQQIHQELARDQRWKPIDADRRVQTEPYPTVLENTSEHTSLVEELASDCLNKYSGLPALRSSLREDVVQAMILIHDLGEGESSPESPEVFFDTPAHKKEGMPEEEKRASKAREFESFKAIATRLELGEVAIKLRQAYDNWDQPSEFQPEAVFVQLLDKVVNKRVFLYGRYAWFFGVRLNRRGMSKPQPQVEEDYGNFYTRNIFERLRKLHEIQDEEAQADVLNFGRDIIRWMIMDLDVNPPVGPDTYLMDVAIDAIMKVIEQTFPSGYDYLRDFNETLTISDPFRWRWDIEYKKRILGRDS